jgi:transcriptional regulator with XRE-family HTH domain
MAVLSRPSEVASAIFPPEISMALIKESDMAQLSFNAVEHHSTTETCKKSSAAPFSVEQNYTTIGCMKSHIRERIKAARQHAKLSQEKLGEYIGVSKSAVSMWETNNLQKHTRPTIDNLKMISQFTGAPVEWLLDDNAEISSDWKRPVEIIQFPNSDKTIEQPRFGDIAIEAAKIIDSLPKDDQNQIINYLRIHIRTKVAQ